MNIIIFSNSLSASNYFLLMDFLHCCDFYMFCNRPGAWLLIFWLSTSLTSFSLVQGESAPSICFECDSSHFPMMFITEEGSESQFPPIFFYQSWFARYILNLFFSSQINHFQVFTHIEAFCLFATFYHPCCPTPNVFQLIFFFLLRGTKLCTKGELQIGIVASGHPLF